jgi:hypothetical protein
MVDWWLFLAGLVTLGLWLGSAPALNAGPCLPVVVELGPCADFVEQPLRLLERLPVPAVWLLVAEADEETRRVAEIWARGRALAVVLSQGRGSLPGELPAARLEFRLMGAADRQLVVGCLRALAATPGAWPGLH